MAFNFRSLTLTEARIRAAVAGAALPVKPRFAGRLTRSFPRGAATQTVLSASPLVEGISVEYCRLPDW